MAAFCYERGFGKIRICDSPALKSRGVALVAVLWIVLLLSILATTVATQSVDGRHVAARAALAAQLDAAADSGIRRTLVTLLANLRKAEMHEPIPGVFTIDDAVVQVRVEREAGRLDLNAGDEDLLIAYFRAAGMEPESARSMANRVRDWQDADDRPREGGLERDGYAALGMTTGPKNGPMETVEELRLVAGAGALTDEQLAGLTVYSHQKEPEAGGPAIVERALQVARREQLGGRAWAEPKSPAGANRVAAGDLVRVQACGGDPPARRCREAVVRLTGSIQEPVQVFLWRSISRHP